MRTKAYALSDKVSELLKMSDEMMRRDLPYAVEIRALAVDITEALGLDKEQG